MGVKVAMKVQAGLVAFNRAGKTNGDVFVARMGAGAIKELLQRVDVEMLAEAVTLHQVSDVPVGAHLPWGEGGRAPTGAGRAAGTRLWPLVVSAVRTARGNRLLPAAASASPQSNR